MTAGRIDRLIELSSRKKNTLEEIFDLNIRQKDFIEEDNMEGINSMLTKKQALMEEIDNLDKEFMQIYDIVKREEGIESINVLDVNKYQNLKSLKERVNEINTVLDNIRRTDEENILNMRTNIDKVKAELKQVKKGQIAYKGYNYTSGESILIDEKK